MQRALCFLGRTFDIFPWKATVGRRSRFGGRGASHLLPTSTRAIFAPSPFVPRRVSRPPWLVVSGMRSVHVYVHDRREETLGRDPDVSRVLGFLGRIRKHDVTVATMASGRAPSMRGVRTRLPRFEGLPTVRWTRRGEARPPRGASWTVRASLSSNDFRPGVTIELDGAPWRVQGACHVRSNADRTVRIRPRGERERKRAGRSTGPRGRSDALRPNPPLQPCTQHPPPPNGEGATGPASMQGALGAGRSEEETWRCAWALAAHNTSPPTCQQMERGSQPTQAMCCMRHGTQLASHARIVHAIRP